MAKKKYNSKGNRTKTKSQPVLDGWELKDADTKSSDINKIVFALSCGATLEDVSKILGVSINTLYNWRDKHKEVATALSKGYMECGGRAYAELNKLAYDESVAVELRVSLLNKLYDNSMKRYEAIQSKLVEEVKGEEDSKVVIKFEGVGIKG